MSGRPISQLVPDMLHIDQQIVANVHVAVENTITAVTAMARDEHEWKHQTGATRKSLNPTIETAANGASASLKAEGNAARLSGGTEPHEIVAHGRALKFDMNGTTMYRKRVRHPGTAPDPYLNKAADKAEEMLLAEVDAAILRALGG